MERKKLFAAFDEARQERSREEAERVRIAAEAEAQRQKLAPEYETVRAEKIQASSEQALQFIEIMRTYGVPTIGYYNTERRMVREAGWDRYSDSSARGYYERPRLAEYVEEPIDTPAFLGWVAISSVVNRNHLDYAVDEVLPGVFVSERGQTYPCSDVRVGKGLTYVTRGYYHPGGYANEGQYSPFAEPDPTLLAEDEAVDKMIQNLKQRGIV